MFSLLYLFSVCFVFNSLGSNARAPGFGRRMIRLETLIEPKFLNSSFSSLLSYLDEANNSPSSNSRQQYLSQQYPPPSFYLSIYLSIYLSLSIYIYIYLSIPLLGVSPRGKAAVPRGAPVLFSGVFFLFSHYSVVFISVSFPNLFYHYSYLYHYVFFCYVSFSILYNLFCHGGLSGPFLGV